MGLRVWTAIVAALTAGCVAGAPCVGRIVEPWQFEWWVQIRNAAGKVGWTREPEKFDNKDALGQASSALIIRLSATVL